MVSESGLALDWAPTYVMRPNSGPSVQEQSEQPLTYNASKNGKDYYDFLTLAGKKKYGIDIHSSKDYILMNGKPKEL